MKKVNKKINSIAEGQRLKGMFLETQSKAPIELPRPSDKDVAKALHFLTSQSQNLEAEIVTSYYLVFDKNSMCIGISLYKRDVSTFTDDILAITDAEHAKYKEVWDKELQAITLVKNKITLVDKYTPEQIKERDAESIKVKLISEAKDLLRLTDRFSLSPYIESLTELERTALNDLRAVWLSVAKGVIKILPETPEFVKKLLEL